MDEFSFNDVRNWKRAANAMDRYQLGLYYALEAQRRHDRGDLMRSLESARGTKPLDLDRWVRVSTYRYSMQPLNAYGSTIAEGGRFNYSDAIDSVDSLPFPALYIAANRTVAEREYHGYDKGDKRLLSAADFALMPKKSTSIVYVDGVVENYVDLTRPEGLQDFLDIINRYKVSKDVNELAKIAGIPARTLVDSVEMLVKALYEPNWRGWVRQFGLPSNSQTFGKLVWEAGYDGIVYRSVRGSGRCLALFPDNLPNTDSRIWIPDDVPHDTIKTLDASNWETATKADPR